jgi:hypothetical protein
MTEYILVVAKQRDDVFCALFFDALPADLRRHIRILEFGHDALASALAGAAAVIVMRHGLFSFGGLAAAAGRAGVPRYYFLDDNLLLLQHEPEVYGPYWSGYTDANVSRALRGFEAVMLASQPLTQYFEERQLHPRLIEYPPIAWPILRARDAGWRRDRNEPFRIAFFGGEHRRDLFVTLVYPAARRLADDQAVELVLFGIDSGSLPSDRSALRIVHLPYDVRYGAALDTLARRRIDVLAHPTPPSRNNPYRNANVLINARSIGSVALLSNLPPYDHLGSPPPAIVCDNSVDRWTEALRRLSSDSVLCAETFRHADQYCRRQFSGAANADAIRQILAAHEAPRFATRAARFAVAGPALAFDRAVFKAKAIARRSGLVRRAA